jgi:hypothetical protein
MMLPSISRSLVVVGSALVVGFAAPARAQVVEVGAPIPPAYLPPAGMCRIWIENVPPAQQPAPTDCTTAVKTRPQNGRVVFGEKPKAARARSWLDELKDAKRGLTKGAEMPRSLTGERETVERPRTEREAERPQTEAAPAPRTQRTEAERPPAQQPATTPPRTETKPPLPKGETKPTKPPA